MFEPPSTPIDRTRQWAALADHATAVRDVHLRDLFAQDPSRAATMTTDVADLHVDWSKNVVTADTVELLVDLARASGLGERIEAMFAGEAINTTEGRAVLHAALRAPRGESWMVDGVDVAAEVHGVLDAMAVFARDVREGRWTGADGRRIRTVVNIGIGGSHLGPEMAARALASFAHPDIELRFVSNVDGNDVWWATRDLDPAETLFVVSSKSFGTIETLTNARSARDWLTERLGDDAVARHFVAVSTNTERVSEFGIDPANMFGFWDWVGGPLLALLGGRPLPGPDLDRATEKFRGAARRVSTPWTSTSGRRPSGRNLPALLLALLGVWYGDFLGARDPRGAPLRPSTWPCSRRVPPAARHGVATASRVRSLSGRPVSGGRPARWCGVEPGTNGQHAFFQLLHQGTRSSCPADLHRLLPQPEPRAGRVTTTC